MSHDGHYSGRKKRVIGRFGAQSMRILWGGKAKKVVSNRPGDASHFVYERCIKRKRNEERIEVHDATDEFERSPSKR